MDFKRRYFNQQIAIIGLMAAAGLISTAQAEEWNRAAFDAKSIDDAYQALAVNIPERSAAINLVLPDLSENGALVPVTVSTDLKAQQIAILVEKNPNALAAQFFFTPVSESFVTTKIKMAQTSNVFALVKVDAKWLLASKEVKVTLGGCGS